MKIKIAHSVTTAPCSNGVTIGLDLCDVDGEVFAHAHFDADTALAFATDFHNAIAELLSDPDVVIDDREKIH